MSRKEQFNKLLTKHGYTSVNNFCIRNQLNQSNTNNRIKNESIQVEIKLLFDWADILHEPIDTLLEIFYPERMEQNQKYNKH